MAEAIRYYLESDWGWGEHMSDVYGGICEQILMVLLLHADDEHPELRAVAKKALQELLELDMYFAGGPRVPAIRCFAMDWAPQTLHGDWISWGGKPLQGAPHEMNWSRSAYYRAFGRAGLEEGFEFPSVSRGPVDVACYRPARSLSWVDDRWRFGVFSEYPWEAQVNEITHGLQWHSMPVAFYHANGDWGYLQYQTEELGHIREAPHSSRGAKYGKHSRVLSNEDPDAKLGFTYGMRHGRSFSVFRRLPAVPDTWDWARDRFRLIDPSHGNIREETIGGWFVLDLPYESETLRIACRSVGAAPIELDLSSGEIGETLLTARWRWEEKPEQLGLLWYFEMVDDGEKASLPTVSRLGSEFEQVRFADGSAALLDPAAKIPWMHSGN